MHALKTNAQLALEMELYSPDGVHSNALRCRMQCLVRRTPNEVTSPGTAFYSLTRHPGSNVKADAASGKAFAVLHLTVRCGEGYGVSNYF
jgi:hypothetical protein